MTNLYLSLIDLDSNEKDLFLEYLCKAKHLESIYYLESEFKDTLLEFLDLFQGEIIKIPSKQELVSIANQVIIYNFLRERNFTTDAYKQASTLFKKRIVALERIVEKIDNIKNKEDDVND